MVDRGLFDKKYHISLLGNQVIPIQNPNYIQRQVLGTHFQPSNWDVICHNEKEYQDHVGNKRFKICIENHLSSYMEASSRITKSAIITNLISSIRDSSTQTGGGFVRFDESRGQWYEVGEKSARDKVGQSLRDAARLQQQKHTRKSIESSRDDPLCHAKPKSSSMVSEQMSMGKIKRIHSKKSTHMQDTQRLSPSETPPTAEDRLFQWEHDTMSIMPVTHDNSFMVAPDGKEDGNLSSDQVGSEDSGRFPLSSSSEIDTAGELLEWFENDF